MTDLEITKLCADAMGFDYARKVEMCPICDEYGWSWEPLTNDAQAMAMVKRFFLYIGHYDYANEDSPDVISRWEVYPKEPQAIRHLRGVDPNLNRAICECVAKMQASK